MRALKNSSCHTVRIGPDVPDETALGRNRGQPFGRIVNDRRRIPEVLHSERQQRGILRDGSARSEAEDQQGKNAGAESHGSTSRLSMSRVPASMAAPKTTRRSPAAGAPRSRWFLIAT